MSNRCACVAVAVLMTQVPQINSELVEFVVAQISMSQQTAEQGESKRSLPACSLKHTLYSDHLSKETFISLLNVLITPYFIITH